jgi:hypothetical protein
MTIFWPFKNKQTASRGSAEAVGATLLARQVLHLRSEGYVFSLGGLVSWGFYQVTQKNGVFLGFCHEITKKNGDFMGFEWI